METPTYSTPNTTPNFGYSGEHGDWAIALSVTRDSGTLDRSNWEVITKDITERFPDDATTEYFSHWLCGWIEHLLVRPDSHAFDAMVTWQHKLDQYPVADEQHWSEMEYNEALDYEAGELRMRPWNFSAEDAKRAAPYVWDKYSERHNDYLGDDIVAEDGDRFFGVLAFLRDMRKKGRYHA